MRSSYRVPEKANRAPRLGSMNPEARRGDEATELQEAEAFPKTLRLTLGTSPQRVLKCGIYGVGRKIARAAFGPFCPFGPFRPFPCALFAE